MSIFNKYDYEKDFLRLEFDKDEQKYDFYYGQKKIEYNELTQRTKRKLDSENKYLKDNPEKLQEEIDRVNYNRRFLYLNSKSLLDNNFESFGINDGSMANEIADYLNKLAADENLVLGIHRTGVISIQKIKDILENGLELTGHMSSGVKSVPKLSDNISFYAENKKAIKELMYADFYKNSLGSILIAIPLEDLEKNLCIVRETEDGLIVKALDPKYIIGFVPTSKKHHISKIITLKDFQKEETREVDFSLFDFDENNNKELEENKKML